VSLKEKKTLAKSINSGRDDDVIAEKWGIIQHIYKITISTRISMTMTPNKPQFRNYLNIEMLKMMKKMSYWVDEDALWQETSGIAYIRDGSILYGWLALSSRDNNDYLFFFGVRLFPNLSESSSFKLNRLNNWVKYQICREMSVSMLSKGWECFVWGVGLRPKKGTDLFVEMYWASSAL